MIDAMRNLKEETSPGAMISGSQEINNNRQLQEHVSCRERSSVVPARQTRSVSRQYLMQVNGVQVTPLPSPTTLVFQGHFTAFEADSTPQTLMLQTRTPAVWPSSVNRQEGRGITPRTNESRPASGRSAATGNHIQITDDSKGPEACSGGKLPSADSLEEQILQNNPRATRSTQCHQVAPFVLRDSNEYNPSCMFSKGLGPQTAPKSETESCQVLQSWRKTRTQGKCMDILNGTEKVSSSTQTNNNTTVNVFGKLDLGYLTQGNDLPNIGSFLEYLEQL